MRVTSDEAIEISEALEADPLLFVRGVLGDEPEDYAARVLESVRDNKITVWRSCHGVGKSWTAARAALWFGCAFLPSQTITTAPGQRQVKGILWKEIPVAHAAAKYELGGEVLQQEIRWSEDHKIWGFTANQYNENLFQGFHEDYLLIIVDEAAGVSPTIMKGVKACLTSENARLLLIGNPTDASSEFASYFRKNDVAKFKTSAFDTPNFVEFGITIDDIRSDSWREKITGPLPKPHLVTPQWVADIYEDVGGNEQDPYWMSRVMAEWPIEGENTLIPLAWIEAAQDREILPEDGDPNHLGIDVARSGGDESVIMHRHGGRARVLLSRRGLETMGLAGETIAALEATLASVAKVDVVGIGAGVVDRLEELGKPVQAVNVGEAASEPERFVNKRAEYFWGLREIFQGGAADIDPHDAKLAAQLSSIRYKYDSRGRLQIESKDEAKKRGVKSPDRADALMLAFAPEDPGPAVVW